MVKLVLLLAIVFPMTTPSQTATTQQRDEAEIRTARDFSNKSIVRRNLLGVGESLDKDYVAVIGDGSFVPSREVYLKLFKQDFDSPKNSLRYERIIDSVDVSVDKPLAAEHGHWVATNSAGAVTHTGTYMAMWRHGAAGWKLRSELFVTLTSRPQR
jgi:ketosteroid isomerase-like protein